MLWFTPIFYILNAIALVAIQLICQKSKKMFKFGFIYSMYDYKMEKISIELEQKIVSLIKQNKLIEAVAIVKSELNLGLKESKEIVDKYKLLNKE